MKMTGDWLARDAQRKAAAKRKELAWRFLIISSLVLGLSNTFVLSKHLGSPLQIELVPSTAEQP